MPTHLSHAITAFIAAQNTNASAFGRTIGIHQGTISRIGSGDRPAVDTLHAMCTKLPDQRATLGLLVAHLRDEIERAGRDQTEITVEVEGLAEADIQLLARAMRTDPDLKAILHHFAQMIRSHKPSGQVYEISDEQQMSAAEEAPRAVKPPTPALDAARERAAGAPHKTTPVAPQPTPPALGS